MAELERDLATLARELDHPPTPDLAGAVAHRLREAQPRRPQRTRRIVAGALALALLVPAGTAAAVPSVRDAVLEALGIKGVRIERVPERLPPSPGAKLDLGRRVAPQRAAGLVNFEPLLARLAELGEPDEVYHRTTPAGGSLSFVYGARASIARSRFTRRALVLTQFRGSEATRYAGKLAGMGTIVEPVVVDGRRGAWLAGEPHQFFYTDAGGQIRTETLRLAGNTLLWQRGPLTLRLEGVVSKAAALRIARSVR